MKYHLQPDEAEAYIEEISQRLDRLYINIDWHMHRNILDVCCGIGSVVNYLRKLGSNAH